MDILKVKRNGYNINRWIDEDSFIRVFSQHIRHLRYQRKTQRDWRAAHQAPAPQQGG